MAETILCSNNECCNCTCNCQAFLTNNRKIIVDFLEIDENDYTFHYTITNTDSSFCCIVFCIECPISQIEISSTNTSIAVIGNPNVSPVVFTECFTSGCETGIINSFHVEYGISSDIDCRHQGIKININQADTITEISFALTFTLAEDFSFNFNAGKLKLKMDEVVEVINDFCVPGCFKCNTDTNTCDLWKIEKNILRSNKDVFIHFSQLLFPPNLDLSSLTITELESRIRSLTKIQKSSANLLCDVAKALERLNELQIEKCCSGCIQSEEEI